MIRILVADDHAMFRQGLLNLLQNAEDIEIVAECSNGIDALDRIRLLKPDVAVLDVSMPRMDGITLTEMIRREGLQTVPLILTMHDDPDVLARAISAGARGVVLKDDAFEELLDAVRTIADGGTLERKSPEYSDRVALSERERQVLTMIARGCTNRMISADMGISVKTVDTHRSNIMRKLALHSTAELVRHAIKTGLT